MSTSLSGSQLSGALALLSSAQSSYDQQYPGAKHQYPVHTVYGGANLYRLGSYQKLARLSLASLTNYAPDYQQFAIGMGLPGANVLAAANNTVIEAFMQDEAVLKKQQPQHWLACSLLARVQHRLQNQAVEDQRVDFEDGYGYRPDAEEDADAIRCGVAMAQGLLANDLPAYTGLRIKSLSAASKVRALRTLDLFLTALCAASEGQLPDNFNVTLPKVTHVEQVVVLVQVLEQLEQSLSLKAGRLKIELMVEAPQLIINAHGICSLRDLVLAAKGRCTTVVLGTYDYTAECAITSHHQDHNHPSADFARMSMQAALAGSSVNLCDGVTNLMPLGPHRSAKGGVLTQRQQQENLSAVHLGWQTHFANVCHSLRLGFYQGWDLNPAQLPARYAAVYYFFLMGLDDASTRLSAFINKAAQASMVGSMFDDAATGQGLLNFFIRGQACGAISMAEVEATGISGQELAGRSFQAIVDARA